MRKGKIPAMPQFSEEVDQPNASCPRPGTTVKQCMTKKFKHDDTTDEHAALLERDNGDELISENETVYQNPDENCFEIQPLPCRSDETCPHIKATPANSNLSHGACPEDHTPVHGLADQKLRTDISASTGGVQADDMSHFDDIMDETCSTNESTCKDL